MAQTAQWYVDRFKPVPSVPITVAYLRETFAQWLEDNPGADESLVVQQPTLFRLVMLYVSQLIVDNGNDD